jgi:outer membrane protein TolC
MKAIIILTFGISGWALGHAAEAIPSSATVTNSVRVTVEFIDQLVEQARTNAPALRGARQRAAAAKSNVQAVRTWEDPMFRFGGMFAEPSMRKEDGDIIYGVEEKLPLFGKPKRARRVAEAEAATETANAELRFQEVRRDIASAVLNLALADYAVQISALDFAWLDAMVRAAEEQYRAGAGSQVNVLRLQTERAKRADQLRTDTNTVDRSRVALNRLLGHDLLSAWPTLELPPAASQIFYNRRLVDIALRHEPKLKVLHAEIRKAEATAQATQRQRLPDISVGAENRQYSGSGDWRQSMLFVGLNLPWLNHKKYRSDYQRDLEKVSAAQLDAAYYELSVQDEIFKLITEIDAARRQALLYRDDIIPRQELAVSTARAAWEANRGMLIDVLESRRLLQEARMMFGRAVAEQYQAMSRLVLCCGLGELGALEMIGALPDSENSSQPKP